MDDTKKIGMTARTSKTALVAVVIFIPFFLITADQAGMEIKTPTNSTMINMVLTELAFSAGIFMTNSRKYEPDGRFVNAELIGQGAGVVMVFAPNTRHEDLFRTLEADAAAAGNGLWGACR